MSEGTAARDPRSALTLAATALVHAQRGGATEAEALVIAEDSALTRFANDEIHQNVAETNVRIQLRYVAGKRVGVASTGRIDDHAIRALAETAGAIARASAELEDWGGLPSASQIADVPYAYSASTANAGPELRAEGARAVIAAADAGGVTAYGSYSTGVNRPRVACRRRWW